MDDNIRPTITLKMKPYLQEYVLSQLGNPIATKRAVIGRLIRAFIELRPPNIPPLVNSDINHITFILPQYNDLNIKANLWISPRNQRIIEDILMDHFKNMFYDYMDDRVRFYRNFKRVIIQFCVDKGFTFAYINYEMMKKDYYRRRKSKPKDLKKNLSLFVPDVSLDCLPFVPELSLDDESFQIEVESSFSKYKNSVAI